MKIGVLVTFVFVGLLVFSGCDTGDSTTSVPAKGNINGLVVIPKAQDDNSSVSPSCSGLPIPGGYEPLSNVKVGYLKSDGSEAESHVTDTCGRFYSQTDTNGLATVKISKEGYRTMVSDFAAFENDGKGWGIVSTVDSNNSFAVRVNLEGESVTYRPETGNFKYSVIDTKTGRAVLGIPQSQVTLHKDMDEVAITDYLFNDQEADIVLTLDASGSMQSELTDQNGTVIGTGFDVTYDASKSFIDELSGSAQLGINIFDSDIDFIDRAYISSLKLSGNFVYPADGFERNKKNSKFVIDIYHPNSSVYEANSTRVAEYPYTTEEGYPWGGATAYIDAASRAVTKLDDREAEQKIAVLMTDGGDNSSTKTINTVIKEAQLADVTFYTISMGFEDDNLKALAQATGGIYIIADGSDVGQRFRDVLGEIQYFYEVGTGIDENTTAYYRVDVVLDGETVSGLIDFNSSVPVTPPAEDESEGAQLYLKCMSCHGVYAEKSVYDVTEVINTWNADTISAALKAYKDGTLDRYGYGALMHEQIKTYSDTQIETVSAYIPTLVDANISQP